eukprot:NODE_268_length_12243_cov_0.338109.p3 type:complete len:304 gc:universal NODE_268_length_12243_cov_0.338109:1144-2055(+)
MEDDDFLENIDPNETVIDLTHSRLKEMSSLNLERFKMLRELGMRQNLLVRIENLPLQIEWLDLYDNKIRDVGIMKNLVKLKYLDLSYNLIKEFDPDAFELLVNLEQVFFISNDLKDIPNLSKCTTLRNLELGSNKIRDIKNLEHLTELEELWLGKNRIRRLGGLDQLSNLRILSIQSNRLHKIENLTALVNLEEFYISHNGIEKIEGIENNLKLKVLDISNNRISVLENLDRLVALEELWANDNRLSSFAELESMTGLRELKTVYLERNPLQSIEPTAYRRKVILTLPQLQQLDATLTKESCS